MRANLVDQLVAWVEQSRGDFLVHPDEVNAVVGILNSWIGQGLVKSRTFRQTKRWTRSGANIAAAAVMDRLNGYVLKSGGSAAMVDVS